MKTLAKRVRAARLALKKNNPQYTQFYVAKLLGLEQQSYNDIESGKSKRPRNIEKLAEILRTTPAWLLFGEGESPANVSLDNQIPPGQVPLLPWNLVKDWLAFNDIEKLIEGSSFRAGQSAAGDALVGVSFIDAIFKKRDKEFALKIKDNLMTSPAPGMRSFLVGEVIYVDPNRTPKPMDYVIAIQTNLSEPLFKQYIVDGNMKFLRSLAHAHLTPIDESIKIVGVIIVRADVME